MSLGLGRISNDYLIYNIFNSNIKKFVFCFSKIFKINVISVYRSTKSGRINQEKSNFQNKNTNTILEKQQLLQDKNECQQLLLK